MPKRNLTSEIIKVMKLAAGRDRCKTTARKEKLFPEENVKGSQLFWVDLNISSTNI